MFHKQSKDQIHETADDETLLAEIIHPLHHQTDPKTPYSLAHVVLEPGKHSQPHQLQKSTETYIIVSGKGTLHVDNEQTIVSPGSVAVVPKKSRQFIINTGERNLEFFCIVSPPWQKKQDTACSP